MIREDTRWLTARLTPKLVMAEIESMIASMPPEWRGDSMGAVGLPTRKADLLAWLRERREAYWDAQQARAADGTSINTRTRTAKRQAAGRRVAGDLCKITAAEVNAWLRTLPEA